MRVSFMPEENQVTPGSLSVGYGQSSAKTVSRLATKHSNAGTLKCVRNVPRRVTTTAAAVKWLPSAPYAAALTNRSAETIGRSTRLTMSRTLRLIQLNVRKQGVVHDSLMNDKEIQEATVLAIQEPQAQRIQGRLLITPMGHYKWSKIVPST